MQLQLQYQPSAPLVQALNQQQGVVPIKPLRGHDALAFTEFKKAILPYIKLRFRAGHLAPARMEVVLADISAHLEGPLAPWHNRSWQMITDLHLCLVRDWVLCGPTINERAVRCRLALKAVAAEDFSGSELEEMLRGARSAYYLYHPGILPVFKTHLPITRLDGSTSIIAEEEQRDPTEQARIDNLAAEQDAHLQHAFLIPADLNTAPRYIEPRAISMGPPYLRVAHEVTVEEDDEPPLTPPSVPSRPRPPAIPSPRAASRAITPEGDDPPPLEEDEGMLRRKQLRLLRQLLACSGSTFWREGVQATFLTLMLRPPPLPVVSLAPHTCSVPAAL